MDCLKGRGSLIRGRGLYISDARIRQHLKDFHELDPRIVQHLSTIATSKRQESTPKAIVTYGRQSCTVQFRPDIYGGGCAYVSLPFQLNSRL